MIVAGQYRDRLSNGGERIVPDLWPVTLSIQDFAYSDAWQVRTDGGGHSLEIIDPAGRRQLSAQPAWRASPEYLGSRALAATPARLPLPGAPPVPVPSPQRRDSCMSDSATCHRCLPPVLNFLSCVFDLAACGGVVAASLLGCYRWPAGRGPACPRRAHLGAWR